MTALDELVMTARKLSDRIEKEANDELKFGYDICLRLEQISWEVYRTANELNEIKQYIA